MARVTVAVLEAECRDRTVGGLQEVGAGRFGWSTHVLFVAHQHNDDAQPVEQACVLQRAECDQHDDVAALHVRDAGAASGGVVEALEALERAVVFEHRVEMADEHDLGPARALLGDQVSRATPRGAIHPARLESEVAELAIEHLADRLHARQVHRAAVLVDRSLEQLECYRDVLVHASGKLLLGRRHGGMRGRDQHDACERDQHEGNDRGTWHGTSMMARPRYRGQIGEQSIASSRMSRLDSPRPLSSGHREGAARPTGHATTL